MTFDYLIVGAGLAGMVCAERLASRGKTVRLIDKRDHIGGNTYDCYDAHGVLIHPYGPHIFHTNSRTVLEYLSRFTNWRFYEHRVRAYLDGALYPVPINRTTINSLYGWNLSEGEMRAYLENVREPRHPLLTSEDVVLNAVGHDLCNKFFRGYTRKQWGVELAELSSSVAARVPARTGEDDRYFTDAFQFMPAEGYTVMLQRMVNHPNIELSLGTDFSAREHQKDCSHLIFTGRIDEFFDYQFGPLPYRSIRFEHQHLQGVSKYQEVGTVNYPNDYEFTRITEFRHLTGQHDESSSIVREYPNADGDAYYPIPAPRNQLLYKRYVELAQARRDVTFVGRLAEYKYYNMDQAIAAALKTACMLLEHR